MLQFLEFIFGKNSTCFGQLLCPSSGVFHCTWRPIYIYDCMSEFFLDWEMFSSKFWRKSKHSSVTFFFFLNFAVCEKIRKNIAEQDWPHMTIWRVSSACWIPKATNTHSQYVMLNAFPQQRWLYERTSLLRYTYIACLVLYPIEKKSVLECLMYVGYSESKYRLRISLAHPRDCHFEHV